MRNEFDIRGPIRYSELTIHRIIAPLLLDLDRTGRLKNLPQDNYNAKFSHGTILAVHPNVIQLDNEIGNIFNSLYSHNPFTRQGPTLEEIKNQIDLINDVKAQQRAEAELWRVPTGAPGALTWRWILDERIVDPHWDNLGVTLPEGSPTWQRMRTADRIALFWDIYDSEVVFKHPLHVQDRGGSGRDVGLLSLVFYLP